MRHRKQRQKEHEHKPDKRHPIARKIFAGTTLFTMLSSLAVIAATRIIENSENVARMEERQKSTKELVIEISKDVKWLIKNAK